MTRRYIGAVMTLAELAALSLPREIARTSSAAPALCCSDCLTNCHQQTLAAVGSFSAVVDDDIDQVVGALVGHRKRKQASSQ